MVVLEPAMIGISYSEKIEVTTALMAEAVGFNCEESVNP
jgi:hypothetical protein